MNRPRLSRTLRKTSRGAVAVELALMTLPLVFLSYGAVEFARIVYQYNILAKATRDGVRILTGADADAPANYPSQRAIERTVYFINGDGSLGTPRLTGLTEAMVQICDKAGATACPGGTSAFRQVSTGGATGTINLVRVQINGFPYQPWFGATFLPSLTFGPIGTTMMSVK